MASLLAQCLIGEARRSAGLSPDDRAMRLFVRKALTPMLKITFLDGGKETILIQLRWVKNGYSQGSHVHPALYPYPTPQQLRQIGGPIGKVPGGEYAMEVIYSSRYEGNERMGEIKHSEEEDRETIADTPSMYIRPLTWEFMNDEGDPPEEMYAQQ